MWNKLRNNIKTNSKRGSIFIEFAVVLPLLVFFLFMIVYMGLFMHDYVALNNITRSAARYTAVATSGANMETKTTNVKTYLKNSESGKLMLYNVDFDKIRYVKPDGLSGVANDEGYIYKEADDKTVRVVLKAVKSADSPLLVDEFIPKILTSSLKMKLED